MFSIRGIISIRLKKYLLLTVFNLLFLFVLSAYSSVPVIRNMQIQSESGNIKIIYDLDNYGGSSFQIFVTASIDGGRTYDVSPVSITGEVGENIEPGIGKEILWNASIDLPGVPLEDIKIRLNANNGYTQLTYIIGNDNALMVLIPAGEFQMGSENSENEMPVHTVYLDDFYMDVHEVTNAQYQEFLNATGHELPEYWDDPRFNAPDQPVVGVTWYDAVAYCQWAGKRLPTEAEWEKAARGGLVGYKYPWGDTLTRDNANYVGTGGTDIWNDTSPVRSFAPNGYGLFDMIGNVYEWCLDYYDYNYYYISPSYNPMGPEEGNTRVLRGGSCYDGYLSDYLRVASRFNYYPETTNGIIGFRCVMDIPE